MAPGPSPQLRSDVDTTAQFSRKVNKPFVRLQAGGLLTPWEAQASIRKGGLSVQGGSGCSTPWPAGGSVGGRATDCTLLVANSRFSKHVEG